MTARPHRRVRVVFGGVQSFVISFVRRCERVAIVNALMCKKLHMSGRKLIHVSKVPKIGIGGSLAAPPLPHHRTYGSVYGGSRSYANALRSNDSTRVGWAFGFMHHRERFDVFPQRLPGFTRRRR